MCTFVVLIKQNENYINMHGMNNLKQTSSKHKTDAVKDGANYSRFLWDSCLVTSRNEANEVDETSFNKKPTGSQSRFVSHKQISEDAHR